MVARRVLLSLVGVSLLVVAVVVHGQQRSSPTLVGVWKITEVTTTGVGGRTLTNLQPSILIFTPRYFSVTQIGSESPRADLPDPSKPTDKELADSVRPFAARAGTYEV